MIKEENRSEGIARLTSIITALLVIGWALFVINEIYKNLESVPIQGWAIIGGGFFIAYYVPQLICKIVYWIIDGFKEDKGNIS